MKLFKLFPHAEGLLCLCHVETGQLVLHIAFLFNQPTSMKLWSGTSPHAQALSIHVCHLKQSTLHSEPMPGPNAHLTSSNSHIATPYTTQRVYNKYTEPRAYPPCQPIMTIPRKVTSHPFPSQTCHTIHTHIWSCTQL